MALPRTRERPHPVVASFLFPRPFPGDGSRRNSFQRLIGQPPLEEWPDSEAGSENPFQFLNGNPHGTHGRLHMGDLPFRMYFLIVLSFSPKRSPLLE